MPIQHSIWKVSAQPERLSPASLASEQLLESMIVANCGILSDQWMLIGQQEKTPYSGRIDLLALAPDSSVVLIELKRNQTPREVVAQALDYAAWLEELSPRDVASIYQRFRPNRNLGDDFRQRFGLPLDEQGLKSHQIVIVASSLDDSTERIIRYLGQRDIAINVIFFQVFSYGSDQFISRAWMLDPTRSQVNAAVAPQESREPWNGEFYVSFGHDDSRSWAEAVQYGFISAGGGLWYSNTLKLLQPGDRVWVKAPGFGFVGVGRVTGAAQPLLSFQVTTPVGQAPAMDALKEGLYHKEFADDSDRCEYFVPVQWLQTVPIQKAINEVGLFGNQNTVCKPITPKWRATVDRLKQCFTHFDDNNSFTRTETPSSATP
jgi:hypothetical protein